MYAIRSYYGRQVVSIDSELRSQTKDAAKRLHELIDAGKTPLPVFTKKCLSCSFYATCLPETFSKTKKVDRYLNQVFEGE